VLIWEERDARTDEVHDALPVPEWPGYVAKFIALMTAIATIQVLVIVVAICVQAAIITPLSDWSLRRSLAGPRSAALCFLCGAGILVHVLSPNKYVGYFASLESWLPISLSGVRCTCDQYAGICRDAVDDLLGLFRLPALDRQLVLVCFVLEPILCDVGGGQHSAAAARPRHGWKARLANAQQRFHGSIKVVGVLAAAGFCWWADGSSITRGS